MVAVKSRGSYYALSLQCSLREKKFHGEGWWGRACPILELLYLTFFKWIIKEIVPSYHRFEKHALVGKPMSYNIKAPSINVLISQTVVEKD